MTVYPEPNCSQAAVVTPGGRQFWLGTIGHVTGMKYSYTYPGGDDKMSCTLEVPALYRHEALNVGNTVRVFRGGHRIWGGVLDEPAPGASGWAITAVGDGNRAADFRATYSAWPSGQPDEVINNAISRGLPWVNPGIGQPTGIWLGDQPDSGAKTVKEVLDTACSKGGLGWQVSNQPGGLIGADITLAALPTAPTRLLLATTPVPRTMGGDIRSVYLRYQSAADNVAGSTSATYAVTSVTNTGHGGQEVYVDLSSSGVMSAAAALAVGQKILQRYVRASFAGPFPVGAGYLLTTGGVAVDPGCEKAGFVCRLIVTDYAYGAEISPLGPIQFIVAGYEWDDHARTGTITPYQTIDQSLSSVIAMETPPAPPAAAA